MADHRLNCTLHTDPTLIAYVGVAEGPQRRWECVAYGGGRHVTLTDGSRITVRSDTPYVITWSDGGLLEAANAFEPLPAAVLEAGARTAQLKQSLRDAFATVPCPGPRRLAGTQLGTEPILLEREFAGVSNWRALAQPEFLDAAPDGFGTSLTFFSNEAFRHYLPAYVIADLHGSLSQQNPAFHLTHGLTDATRDVRVNPRLYGEWTWFECRQERFAEFTHEQVAVVVAYLRWKSVRDAILRRDIDEALRNYWAASHRVACPRRLPR